MRPRKFFFHYNKPASQQMGYAQISVHFKGVCHIVDNVICEVKSSGRIRNSSPKFVMEGLARNLEISDEGNVALLT